MTHVGKELAFCLGGRLGLFFGQRKFLVGLPQIGCPFLNLGIQIVAPGRQFVTVLHKGSAHDRKRFAKLTDFARPLDFRQFRQVFRGDALGRQCQLLHRVNQATGKVVGGEGRQQNRNENNQQQGAEAGHLGRQHLIHRLIHNHVPAILVDGRIGGQSRLPLDCCRFQLPGVVGFQC